MSDSLTIISELLRTAGFQQVTAPLCQNIMNIVDVTEVTTLAYAGTVWSCPQTYLAYLEEQLPKYPAAKGVFTVGYIYRNHSEPRAVCEFIGPGHTTQGLMKLMGLGEVTTNTVDIAWNQTNAMECRQGGRVALEFSQRGTDPLVMRQAFYNQEQTSQLVKLFTRIRVTTELEKYLEIKELRRPRIGGCVYLDTVQFGQPTKATTIPTSTLVNQPVKEPVGKDQMVKDQMVKDQMVKDQMADGDVVKAAKLSSTKPKNRLQGSTGPPMVPPKSLEDNMRDLAQFVKSTKKS